MPEAERIATAYHYVVGELQGLRVYARRELLDDVVERIERIEYTMSRLAQSPGENRPPVLPFPRRHVVLDPAEEEGGAA